MPITNLQPELNIAHQQTYQFGPVFNTLQVAFFADIALLNAFLFEIRLNSHVLGVEITHIWYNILHHVHVRKWVDLRSFGCVSIDFTASREQLTSFINATVV